MRNKNLSARFTVVLAIFVGGLLATSARSVAQSEGVLQNFNVKDGSNPLAGLISDKSGNLYGTTDQGGLYSGGTAFELMPQAGGGWTEKVLHSFGNHKDGNGPASAMVFDGEGNLYGTTSGGGPGDEGTVFELLPQPDGAWTEKILHAFSQFGDGGVDPVAGLVLDTAGNLYGTTIGIESPSYGTVFMLTPTTGGQWMRKNLYSFQGKDDGSQPNSTLLLDSQGNLYGTTASAGADFSGTVFELSPADGSWHLKVLYTFGPNVPAESNPSGELTMDAAGNLYGTTIGGYAGDGTVYELSPTASGPWTATVLHTFEKSDGYQPLAGVVFDAAGNLFGTTQLGGTFNEGTVFELSAAAGGEWTFALLHSFNDNGSDGYLPQSNVMVGASGNLYGTTYDGGISDEGTVFEIKP